MMISELLSAIHGVDAGVDWNGVAAFLQQHESFLIFHDCIQSWWLLYTRSFVLTVLAWSVIYA